MDNTVHRHLQDPWLLRDTFTIVRELRDFGEDTKVRTCHCEYHLAHFATAFSIAIRGK